MKVAVAGLPGAWSTERLADALRRVGADVCVLDLAACTLSLPDGRISYRGQPLERLRGVVVKKIGDAADGWVVRERLTLLADLEASGVPVLSPPARLEVALNRYRMTVELARAGIPVPETVVTEDLDEAEAVVARFGTAVLKPLFTSKGRGMHRLERTAALRPLLEAHRRDGGGPFYLQRFVPHPGRDLAIAVLEGRCLGAYWRVAGQGQWMTTILSGGHYAAADPPTEAIDLAVRAANHFGLLFTVVDLVERPGGGFTALEVSAFGGFRGLLSACGVDAAPSLAEAVLRRFAEAAS